jgi:hypothetical protein
VSDPTRLDALTFVQRWYADHPADHPRELDEVLVQAKDVTKFLGVSSGGIVLRLRSGPVVDQRNGQPVVHPIGGSVMQLHDNEQVSYSLTAADAKGIAIAGDSFTATSDTTDVVAITQQADGTFLAVAGVPGSAIVTFTDGTLSVTEAIDVVPGSVATIQVTAGTVETQPAA